MSYYEDLYDEMTVKGCRSYDSPVYKPDPKLTELENKKRKIALELVCNLALHYEKGDRHLARGSTIREWMERDRKRDAQFERATEPKAVCQFCLKEMELFDKSLETVWKKGEVDRVVFYFRCAECKIGKDIDEFGGTVDHIPWKCPRCTRKMSHESKRDGKKVTTKDRCPHCGYEKEDVFELGKHEPIEKPTPEEEKQLRIDKDRFCLTEKQGFEFAREKESMEQLKNLVAGSKQREENDKKLKKIKKLKVLEVEKILSEAMKDSGYIRLALGKPEIVRDVIVEFIVHDEKDRSDYDSKRQLRKLIKSTLEGTNWRLMTDAVDYNLGVLSGRLRGYQHDEELLKLVAPKKGSIENSIYLDETKQIKY